MKNKLMVLSLALFMSASIISSESCFTGPEPKAIRVTTAMVPSISKFDQAKQRLMQAAVGSINPEIITVTGKTSKIADVKDMFASGYKLFSATNRKLIEGINNVDNYNALKNTVKNTPKLAAVNVAMKMLSYPKTTGLGLAGMATAGAYGAYKQVQAKKADVNALVCNYDGQPYFGQPSKFAQAKLAVINNPGKTTAVAVGSAALVAGTVYLYKKGYFKNPFAKAVKPVVQVVETKKETPAAEPVKKQVKKQVKRTPKINRKK